MGDIYDGHRRRKSDSTNEDAFSQCPRYDQHELSDEQIEAIAERAAKKAVQMARDDFYKDVGETIVGKFKWLVGAVIVGLFVWLASKGAIKL